MVKNTKKKLYKRKKKKVKLEANHPPARSSCFRRMNGERSIKYLTFGRLVVYLTLSPSIFSGLFKKTLWKGADLNS